MKQMYAIRLKPGTYPPPLSPGMYVAQSFNPSELRFTSEIQYARTWDSYPEAYGYLDENLYGSADVVPVVSVESLLADINKIGDEVETGSIPQPALDDVENQLNGTQSPYSYDTSSPESDNILHLYRLYRTSKFSVYEGEPLAEEWATEAEAADVNKEAIPQGFIWIKATE